MVSSDTAMGARLEGLLEQAWMRGWAKQPALVADQIAGDAIGGPWRKRLGILCRALNEEADLNSVGLTAAYGQLRKLVRARKRLQLIADVSDEIRVPPLLIVGQMRSGTTRIHRLLACDRRFAVNRLFEQLDPVPYRWPVDPRPMAAAVTSRLSTLFNPRLHAIHPTSPYAAEEDFGLHAFSFWGAQFEGQWRVPSFARHVEEADPGDAYREFAQLLRVNARHRGLDKERPWLLKAPQFTQELDAVLDAFPGAKMIVLRRDPAALVGSSASLVWNHSRIQSNTVTKEVVGREWLHKTRLRSERMEASLERHRDVPQVALDYADVSRDWRGAIKAIYAMLGWTFDGETAARMERLTARSKAHHGHRYELAEFGLCEHEVSAALA